MNPALLSQDVSRAPIHFNLGGFDLASTLCIIAAALLVLQTHVRFERHANGTFTALVEKKPTSNRLLKYLVKKLLSLRG